MRDSRRLGTNRRADVTSNEVLRRAEEEFLEATAALRLGAGALVAQRGKAQDWVTFTVQYANI